jgi:hypothetical protein
VFQVANNEIYEYGMVLFWSHFMTHFSQTGLIFNIETSKSLNNGLVLVSVVFVGLILVSHRSLWVSFCWSSKLSYLVSLRSLLGLALGLLL